MLSIEIEGLDALIRKLGGNTLYAGPVRDAFNRSVIDLESAVKETTPVDTGRLRSSVTHAVDSRPIPLWGKVGSNVNYAQDVEFGTNPHIIKPRFKRALAFHMAAAMELSTGRAQYRNRKTGKLNLRKSKGNLVIVRSVKHPGTKPYHMFTNAMKDGRQIVEEHFRRAAKEIEQSWGR